jgi:hypothetical protein
VFMLVTILLATGGAFGQQGGINTNTSSQAISSSSTQGNTSSPSATSATDVGNEPGNATVM